MCGSMVVRATIIRNRSCPRLIGGIGVRRRAASIPDALFVREVRPGEASRQAIEVLVEQDLQELRLVHRLQRRGHQLDRACPTPGGGRFPGLPLSCLATLSWRARAAGRKLKADSDTTSRAAVRLANRTIGLLY